MKTITCSFTLLVFISISTFGQTQDDEVIQTSGWANIDSADSQALVKALDSKRKEKIFSVLETIANSQKEFASPVGEFDKSRQELSNHLTRITEGRTNTAVIVVFRNMTPTHDGSGNHNGFGVDYESLNTIILTRHWAKNGYQNYLFGTKKIVFVYIDLMESNLDNKDKAKQLSNTTIKINYKESVFKKSFKELVNLSNNLFTMGKVNTTDQGLKMTLVHLAPRRVKNPCVIELSNKAFKEPILFEVHEANIGTFQIGLVNTKFDKKNFSISDGNLIVKADSAEKAAWKSNLFALVELHLPRDINSYEPVWKAATMPYNSAKYKFWNRVYKITLDRIGIYGGVKISSDPLSHIYYGFNYSITKELAMNLGWTLNNDVVPQVTDVGNISSIDDALNYAKRQYSKPIFSCGLSFSPSALSKTLGLSESKE